MQKTVKIGISPDFVVCTMPYQVETKQKIKGEGGGVGGGGVTVLDFKKL